MDSSVILEDCYDFTNPCNYNEDSDTFLRLKEENDDFDEDDLFDETDDDPMFLFQNRYTRLVYDNENDKNEKEPKYYSIYDEGWIELIIYKNKAKALQVLKDLKIARLKCFDNLDDAIDFATCGGRVYGDFKFPMVEKASWRMPRSRELVQFRKAILNRDMKIVKDLIQKNPRYLVGNGDTPTILQGGCRYNALHVAAMARSAAACSYILSITSDIAFAERLYGKNESNQQRINVLLDLYLNMPDKGYHETPLHFASKLGAVNVIKVLISYQQCDKNLRNKDGLTALEVACSRFPNHLIIKNEISEALGRQFFVPLLRSKDNVIQPVVGDPCTSENPPICYADRLASPLEVKAIAGPMSEELAIRFRKKWKTPPRNLKSIPNDRQHLSDPEKGFEKLGRKLAGEFQIGWKEYWSFLDSFVDLSSKEGLLVLDGYLKKKYEALGEPIQPQEVSRPSFLSIAQLFRFKRFFRRKTTKPESHVCDSSILTYSEPSNISQNRLKHIDNSVSPKDKRFDFIPMDTDKYYEVFAKRISNALIATNKSETLFEISYFQKYLAGFIKDERFSNIDLTQSHFKVSVFITKRVSDEPESLPAVRTSLDLMMNLEAKDLEDDPGILEVDDLQKVTSCILKHINEMLSIEGGSSKLNDERSNISANSCDCELPSIKIKSGSSVSLCRRLSFSEGEDSSESEESFYSAKSNTEEIENDDDSPPTLSGVFLMGHSPTKVDEDVLEAIESVSLSPSDYPYISRWKTSFQRMCEKGIEYFSGQ